MSIKDAIVAEVKEWIRKVPDPYNNLRLGALQALGDLADRLHDDGSIYADELEEIWETIPE